MPSALRYAVSVAVGSVVTGSVAVATTANTLITVSLFPLYAIVTSLIVVHRQEWLTRSRGDSAGSRAGAAIGGAGAFAGGRYFKRRFPPGLLDSACCFSVWQGQSLSSGVERGQHPTMPSRCPEPPVGTAHSPFGCREFREADDPVVPHSSPGRVINRAAFPEPSLRGPAWL